MWQPKSVLFPPLESPDFYADIWEDFYLQPDLGLCRIDEGLQPLKVDGEKLVRDDFFVAFQNAQFATGTAPVFSLVRLFKALGDWFQAGGPTFTGLAAQRSIGNKLDMSVRLTATDRIRGQSISVMAGTEPSPGIDALTMSAERAAYKLLYRLSYPSVALGQIEGRAALRQGLGLLAAFARAENGSADDRKAGLQKAFTNLDFASQTLRGDGASPPWPEVLRFKAVASFLNADLPGALQCLAQIEDNPNVEAAHRNRTLLTLRREAQHNHAVVLTRMGGFPNLVVALNLYTACLDPSIDDGLRLSAHFGRLNAAAALGRSEWQNFDPDLSAERLKQSWAVILTLENMSLQRPADNRIRQFIISESGHLFGIAWSRFRFSQRGSDRIPRIAEADREIHEAAHSRLHQWVRTHNALSADYAALSHLALMSREFPEARELAIKAVALDAKNEFAFYLAAESALQAGDKPGALAQSALWKDAVTESVFRDLRATLSAG